ncbi:MAG: YeeE/YedE thiosulfate transporter family protein [Opitutaceae bacterium]|nr:YeeE/YedE thiosulfate transporter family protein [Opitutaceae bacterium]
MFESYGMAILGGALIGGAASLALFKVGYPVGISGFLSKAIGTPGSAGWRLSFLGGMLIVALVVGVVQEGALVTALDGDLWKVIVGAACVGLGARLAGGCTSGHSLCGMARMDRDSIVATLVFIGAGALTVIVFGA